MNKNLMIVLATSLLINGFVMLASYLSVAPIGTEIFLFISAFAILPMLFAFLLIPIVLVLLFWRNYRIKALTVFIACIIFLVVGFAGIRLADNIRHNGFVNLAQRSRSLVSAIQRFETKYKKPPKTLDQLVPEFLPAVPNTGIGAYPNYEYIVNENPSVYETNHWILRVNASKGALNWDTFLYFPKQNYPAMGYGGWIERIEDWAYIHE